MPSSPGYKRNYRQEYDRYQGKAEQKKKRASRNSAAKQKRCPLGAEVHHKDGNPKNNNPSNLVCSSKSKNRSFKRNKKAGKA